MDWAKRAANNIFPLSVSKQNLSAALQEWEYRGTTFDIEVPVERCQLCDYEGIRYRYEIVNVNNNNALLIGSECIHRFKVRVIDETGKVLDFVEAKKKVEKDRRKLITDAKTRSLLNSLVLLKGKDTEFDIESFEKYFKERGAFTPAQLSTLIWRLEKYNVQYQRDCFKMVIKRTREKEQLLNLKDWQIKKMWECLTPAQKEFVRKNNV